VSPHLLLVPTPAFAIAMGCYYFIVDCRISTVLVKICYAIAFLLSTVSK
jgi:hypothetical protein